LTPVRVALRASKLLAQHPRARVLDIGAGVEDLAWSARRPRVRPSWASSTEPAERLDETVALSRERFARDTVRVEHMLAKARVGTRVVAYHRLGGEPPPGFEHVLRERQYSGYLDLWIKSEDVPWSPPSARSVSASWIDGRLHALQAKYRRELAEACPEAVDRAAAPPGIRPDPFVAPAPCNGTDE
jgi:hypothetical protein